MKGRRSGNEGELGLEFRCRQGQKHFSRGAPLRGRGTPAIPARLRSERARNSYRNPRITARDELSVVAAPQELVAFDGCDNTDSALFPGFGTLHAPKTAHAHWAGQSDFVGQGE